MQIYNTAIDMVSDLYCRETSGCGLGRSSISGRHEVLCRELPYRSCDRRSTSRRGNNREEKSWKI